MPQLLVRNLPDRTHKALRLRAAEHGTSLEAEVRSILEEAVRLDDQFVLPELVVARRKKGKSLSDLVSEGRR
ncbi:MAG: hypothetical protein U0P81_15775 [Holophagaceae bacterium]